MKKISFSEIVFLLLVLVFRKNDGTIKSLTREKLLFFQKSYEMGKKLHLSKIRIGAIFHAFVLVYSFFLSIRP